MWGRFAVDSVAMGLNHVCWALLLCALMACGDETSVDDASVGLDAAVDAGGGDTASSDAFDPVDAAAEDAGTDSGAVDGGVDAGSIDDDAGSAGTELVRRDGCFFTVEAADEILRIPFGEVGTEHPVVVIEMTIETGPWREDLFDRDVLNHNLFGFTRNGSPSRVRYLGGLGAQVFPPRAPGLDRTTLFFGRVDLEPRPMGMGFMSYTTFRERAPWVPGASYRVRAEWNAETHQQVLDVTRDGAPFSRVVGDIAYYETALTTSGFAVELGSHETEGRDVSPIGATFCDLVVTAF